ISNKTKIIFITEGLFFRLLLQRDFLAESGAVILDEFHERNIHSDVVLSVLKNKIPGKFQTRVIVMSATLEAEKIIHFVPCRFFSARGKMFPVDGTHMTFSDRKGLTLPPWTQAAKALEAALCRKWPGDVLVFMPGMYEINRTLKAMEELILQEKIDLVRLYGELSKDEQLAAIRPSNRRKVIIATNVAETSITLENIGIVIDSGLVRILRFHSGKNINTLETEPVSLSSAEQRKGRAGRTQRGHCIRLWSEKEHERLKPFPDPEIKRIDLSETFLLLKKAGHEVKSFSWFEDPPHHSRQHAEKILSMLGAQDPDGNLTTLGEQMAALPMHPRVSRMVVEAQKRHCLGRVLIWAALISSQNIFTGSKRLPDIIKGVSSDFEILEQVVSEFHESKQASQSSQESGFHPQRVREVIRNAEHYKDILKQAGFKNLDKKGSVEDAILCLLSGFPDQVAVKKTEKTDACELPEDKKAILSDQTLIVRSRLFIAAEITGLTIKGQKQTIVNQLSSVDSSQLKALYPSSIFIRDRLIWNAQHKHVERIHEVLYLNLVIERSPLPLTNVSEATPILVDEFLKGNLQLPGWNEEVEKWIRKTRCVREWFPEKNLPQFSEEDIRVVLYEMFEGASRYSEIKDKPCLDYVKNALSWNMRQFIEQMTPDVIILPNGRKLRIVYEPGNPPCASIVLQHLYDMNVHPTVAGGRQKILLDILAPNHRTVQKTSDIPSFWLTSYPLIKKDLKGRYPKHEWR
ncbi:MAG: hypothetical protein JW774_08085, partial [Candidatus Aureabacteria bacterium]|nr:hypothetical protein [Candidatus Auribacterota bacterium]